MDQMEGGIDTADMESMDSEKTEVSQLNFHTPFRRRRGILLCTCRLVCQYVVIPLTCATDNSRTLCPRNFKLGM